VIALRISQQAEAIILYNVSIFAPSSLLTLALAPSVELNDEFFLKNWKTEN
jgi:hypothetical protein